MTNLPPNFPGPEWKQTADDLRKTNPRLYVAIGILVTAVVVAIIVLFILNHGQPVNPRMPVTPAPSGVNPLPTGPNPLG